VFSVLRHRCNKFYRPISAVAFALVLLWSGAIATAAIEQESALVVAITGQPGERCGAECGGGGGNTGN
jgi:hypothetical protein